MSTVPVIRSQRPDAAVAITPARAELREAAQQFEAILLRRMLASARTTDFGGSELFGKSDDTFREMRDARFAEVAAGTGQLGFAAAIERQLAQRLPGNAD